MSNNKHDHESTTIAFLEGCQVAALELLVISGLAMIVLAVVMGVYAVYAAVSAIVGS